MCGIAGIVGMADGSVIAAMLDSIRHRGPDDMGTELFGVARGGPAMLGHVRLAIIDLSPAGHQPMTNEDGSLWITFNGEIYNYAALRDELVQCGHTFRSHSDTEVVLHGYEEWGEGCVDRLTGMFAFAVYDTRRRELLLVRDRFGIKPLYYHVSGSRLVFASEIKALLEAPHVPHDVDFSSLDLFLTLGYVPGPRTMFRDIQKLQPGHLLRFANGRVRPRQYWSLPSPNVVEESFPAQVRRLETVLDLSVQDHLVADVPVACFLSGGLDSSVITALMARHMTGGQTLKTYCVGYELSESRHDERSHAQLVADHIGTEHYEIVCTDEFAVEALPRLIWHMDEPIAEALLPPYASVCELAQRDVNVAGDDFLRAQYCNALQRAYSTHSAADCRDAIKLFTRVRPRLVYLDVGPPSTADECLETASQLLNIDATTKVVVTGQADAGYATRAVLLGATDYLSKPVDIQELHVVLKRALHMHGIEANRLALSDVADVSSFEGIVGGTSEMQNMFAMLAQVAKTDVTILVQGESGTGKELTARAIHARSPRRGRPFVAINCAAIPDTLLEAELFGSEKGAYTGAHAQRKGKLELADGGTLFLDEIGELPPPLQAKLLRFLQERRVERLGGRQEISVDTRVIAATNKDLKTAIRAQHFREDLYYRLSVIVVTLPPLRDRGLDVLLLANLFLQQNCLTARRRLRFSPRAIDAIVAHNWPGNIRELQNAVQRAVILAPQSFLEPSDLGLSPSDTRPVLTLREARNQAARAVLIQALMRTHGNVSLAARQLGVSRPVIHDLLKTHQLTRRLFRSA